MAEAKTHRGVVLSKFKDAGTGEMFEKGGVHAFDAGAHANYLRAGLIGKPGDDAKTDSKAADKAA